MKLQVRQSVFESNSSSTHTLTMMMKQDYDEWRNNPGKYRYSNDYNDFKDVENGPVEGQLYTKDEIIAFILKVKPDIMDNLDVDFDVIRQEYSFYSFEDDGSDFLEDYYGEFTTPNGETVVAFGEYGFDG